ncbi:MAG: hypothetical protein LBV04_07020, partial [Deferribacteraceae bacterium]|nr:hypothetical protein [Deferribacteraceae bacterium]
MPAIRSGGIASGLDTNAIIDSLVGAAKEPINALETKSHLLGLTKTVFKEVADDLSSLKTTAFNLKLESTFKSKKVDSSNPAVATAVVTPEAAVGSHTVEVMRTAKQASMASLLSKPSLTQAGAGAAEYSEWPGKYVQLEGDIFTDVNSRTIEIPQAPDPVTNAPVPPLERQLWTATSEFKPSDARTYGTQTFLTPIDASLIDENGSIQAGVNLSNMGDMQFEMTIAGGPVVSLSAFKLNDALVTPAGTDESASVKDINHLMSGLEQGLNDQINSYLGTTDKQYIAMRADFDGTNWTAKIYDVSGENIKINAAAANTHVAAVALGLTGTSSDGAAASIKKYHAAADAAGLKAKLEDRNSSIVYKAAMRFDELTTGSFETRLDASMSI